MYVRTTRDIRDIFNIVRTTRGILLNKKLVYACALATNHLGDVSPGASSTSMISQVTQKQNKKKKQVDCKARYEAVKVIYTLAPDARMKDLYRTSMDPSCGKSATRDCTVSVGFIFKCLISLSFDAFPSQLKMDTKGDILMSLSAAIRSRKSMSDCPKHRGVELRAECNHTTPFMYVHTPVEGKT